MKRLFCLAIAVVMLMSTAGAEGTSTYMAYRSNAVTISAADGLGIVSGTFVIKDLSITNGQDPDGRNYVGQVHTLENGEFTFSVGRSASESVASWFNSKISGYNDPSVNGDRTTFDQTADDLNFAFVGDLNLVVDTADDPQGLSVTFPVLLLLRGAPCLEIIGGLVNALASIQEIVTAPTLYWQLEVRQREEQFMHRF